MSTGVYYITYGRLVLHERISFLFKNLFHTIINNITDIKVSAAYRNCRR